MLVFPFRSGKWIRNFMGAEAHRAPPWLRALELTAPIARNPQRIFPRVIDELAHRFGRSTALLTDQESWTYENLAHRARQYAHWALSLGIRQGHVIGLMMPNGPEYLALWLGVTRVGGCVALINTSLRGAALTHSIRAAAARWVVAGQEFTAACAEAVEPLSPQPAVLVHDDAFCAALGAWPGGPAPDIDAAAPSLSATALLIYTSGTSGLPKAVRVSHYRVMQWTHWFAGLIGAGPADRMYNCLPMYHSIGGVVAVGAPLVAGGSVVIRDGFSASSFWPEIRRWNCSLFQYIGELCRYLLNREVVAAERDHSLRLACGNGMRADVWPRFQERFRIPAILEYYASTEGAVSLYNWENQVGSVGRVPSVLRHRQALALVRCNEDTAEPLRDAAGHCIRCETGQPGELIAALPVRSELTPTQFEGYTDAEASERKILRDVFADGDRWYRTGDLMKQDAAGFFYFMDRLGDTFRWKGENVATSEVADQLRPLPGIDDVLVYGVEIRGSEGRAGMAAIYAPGGLDLAALHRHARSTLPAYARPLFLRILRSLPLTGTLKPKKGDLVRDGYDPARCGDEIYLDAGDSGYRRVDAALFARIDSGELGL